MTDQPRPVNKYAAGLLYRKRRELQGRVRFLALCWDFRGGSAFCLDGFVSLIRMYFLDVSARAEPLVAVGSSYPEFFNDRKCGVINPVNEDMLVKRLDAEWQMIAIECVE
jgi:hypothetical protein